LVPALQGAELDGYAFLVLRLPPASGLASSAVVRVTSEGAAAQVVPMLSPHGPDASVNLTVIGDRRYEPAAAPAVVIEENEIAWDWTAMSSDYEGTAAQAIAGGWLVNAGEPLSPYAFDRVLALVSNDPYSSGYGLDGSDPAAAATADIEALRAGLATGSTWVTRLTTRIPSAGFTEGLALTPVDALEIVDRDLTPGIENGPIPSCEGQQGGCGEDFMEDDMGDMDGDDSDMGCASSGRAPGPRSWLVLVAAAFALARRRRLPKR
jgi:hypothetical protein